MRLIVVQIYNFRCKFVFYYIRISIESTIPGIYAFRLSLDPKRKITSKTVRNYDVRFQKTDADVDTFECYLSPFEGKNLSPDARTVPHQLSLAFLDQNMNEICEKKYSIDDIKWAAHKHESAKYVVKFYKSHNTCLQIKSCGSQVSPFVAQ